MGASGIGVFHVADKGAHAHAPHPLKRQDITEPVVLGVKAGLDPKVMIDVLNASSGRNNSTAVRISASRWSRSRVWRISAENDCTPRLTRLIPRSW